VTIDSVTSFHEMYKVGTEKKSKSNKTKQGIVCYKIIDKSCSFCSVVGLATRIPVYLSDSDVIFSIYMPVDFCRHLVGKNSEKFWSLL